MYIDDGDNNNLHHGSDDDDDEYGHNPETHDRHSDRSPSNRLQPSLTLAISLLFSAAAFAIDKPTTATLSH